MIKTLCFQDGPFLAFRLILIIHYKIVSYMNIFFTCKNTLVILLQLYRLYVVQSENRTRRRKQRLKHRYDKYETGNISIISRGDAYGSKKRGKRKKDKDEEDDYHEEKRRKKKGSGKAKDVEANLTDSDEVDSEELDRYEKTPKKRENSTKFVLDQLFFFFFSIDKNL